MPLSKQWWWRDRYLYMMFLPVLAYFIIFKYIPMYGAVIAFKDFRFVDGINGSTWVGLKHFSRLFGSDDFYKVLYNTLKLSFLNIVCGFPMPIIFAVLLNEARCLKFKKTVQSILYIPHFISWVVLGGIIISLLSPSTGIAAAIGRALGMEYDQIPYLMGNKGWWTVVYIVSGIWQSTGWGTIVYLAAITGVDTGLYEAAMIDGAGKFRQIWHITLTQIRGTIAIMLIMRMGSVLSLSFEQIYALQNDMVLDVSDVISTYEYRIGLQGMQYSYTTALGLFKGVVGLVLVCGTNYIANRLTDGEGGLW